MGNTLRTVVAVSLLGGLLAANWPVNAADDTGGRYSMSPADGGFVRLDRQTGAMTFCTKSDATWACAPMGDAQQSSNTEIERLEAENKTLKADKRHLEEMLGMADPEKPGTAPPETGSTTPPLKVPSEQDVDKAFDYFEGMIKKFRERMKKLEEGQDKGQQL
jgi:hypothetical protein